MTEAGAKPSQKFPTVGRQRLGPGSYSLDLSAVLNAALMLDGEPSTFSQIYGKLRDSKIEKPPDRPAFTSDEYMTDKGKVKISGDSGDWPLLRLLRDLLALGVDPHSCTWFYYDHDWSRDADELNIFFVIHGDKIVSEHFSLGHYDPPVLHKHDDSEEPIWHSQPYFDEARLIYCYRKFYTETVTGQLMVLRPDDPILYHYERAAGPNVLPTVQTVAMLKTYRLLWAIIPMLAAIAFPEIKRYMLIVACVIIADVLWQAWATRKIGQ